MADVLPGDGVRVGRLVRFGYADMTAKADSMLFCAERTLSIHEFHHWDSTDKRHCIYCLQKAKKCSGNADLQARICTRVSRILYWAGTPLPGRFVRAAERYINDKRENTHDRNGTECTFGGYHPAERSCPRGGTRPLGRLAKASGRAGRDWRPCWKMPPPSPAVRRWMFPAGLWWCSARITAWWRRA